MTNLCECCVTNEAIKIALPREEEDGEGIWLCKNCIDFIDNFLDSYTSTKWSEVFYNTINAQSNVVKGGE